jgi:hypothetical protein
VAVTTDTVRDALREALVHGGGAVLPAERRKALDRWLRGREEHRKLQAADYVLMSWAKSGRTWLRLMLSRVYQLQHGLPETAFLEYDNLKRQVPAIPSVFFTHGNYLRNYTGDWDTKEDFYASRILFLARDPRDVAVSQYFQWRYRMRPWKKFINDYPAHGEELEVFEFVMQHDAGISRVVEFFNLWARELPRVRASHLVRYEDLRGHTAESLAKVLEFLGTPAKPEEISEAVEYTAVEKMRKIEQSESSGASGKRLAAGDAGNPDSFKVRRAKVGGWRDYFDDDQLRALDDYVNDRLDPSYGYASGG